MDLCENVKSFIKNRGLFISFEGGDGSGKTTQLELLAEFLNSNNVETIATFEPGATELGQTLRNLIQYSEIELNPKTEALLFAADRSFHVDNIIKPALNDKKVVLTDRYIDSSIAYQGAARSLGTDEIENLSLWATDGLLPDITVYFDVNEDTVKNRFKGTKKDKLELAGDSFHKKVRDEYFKITKTSNRYCFIDGNGDIDTVFGNLINALSEKIIELQKI